MSKPFYYQCTFPSLQKNKQVIKKKGGGGQGGGAGGGGRCSRGVVSKPLSDGSF